MMRTSIWPRWSLLAVLAVAWIACPQLAGVEDAAPQHSHWAYRSVGHPSIPTAAELPDGANAVDAFLLPGLRAQGLAFSPLASRQALLRRVTLDLTGLPPTLEEQAAFLADEAPDAYERLVDRLLASPAYGETWGRMWLDLVRYADTAGYNADPTRPLAYRYRDYVINAFNRDLPYDRFLAQQLAADELFSDDPDALAATGFLVQWPDESNASNVEKARQDIINDLTGNVAAVVLAQSLACCQCHDHKFEPLTQRDYYRFQAFFTGVVAVEAAPLGSQAALAEYEQRRQAWLAATAPVRNELQQLQLTALRKLTAERRMKFPAVVLSAIDAPREDRTPHERQLAFFTERQIETIKAEKIAAALDEPARQRLAELQRQWSEAQAAEPRPPAQVEAWMGVEISTLPPPTHFLETGSYDRPGDELQPGFPGVLEPALGNATPDIAPTARSSGRRSALVRWLLDPRHPLTARVIVNRLWQGHFGRGLVENSSDFGRMTGPPSHPELLDYLADELRVRGWRLKEMHRLIVTSHAYRQQSQPSEIAIAIDPENRWLHAFPRRRLTAEAVRDSVLAVAGELNPQMQGPGVRPPLPPNYTGREAWEVTADRTQHGRRSVYLFAKRNLPYPWLAAFDLPDMHETCAQRMATITAPQSLFLLNSEQVLSLTAAFAERVAAGATRDEERIDLAYRLALARLPQPEERQAALLFLSSSASPMTAGQMSEASSRQQALADFCHVLLNCNEFIFPD